MRIRDEEGQAIVLVVLAMGIFLIGAVGLGIDGSMIYSQRQKAQLAADAAATAAMMSVFDGTNTSGAAAFSTSATFTCGIGDAKTPCKYASMDGFGSTASDTITVSFPTSATGVTTAVGFPVNLVEVDVTRSVPTTLMRLLGPTATNVTATATAAIVSVTAPIPIIISHPTLSGALSTNGGVTVKICGGSHRSIEVNSSDPAAAQTSGSGTVDLSHAGPPDTGDCTTTPGRGADFGIWGGPGTPPFTFLGGATGRYLAGASWAKDPLAAVPAPPVPTVAGTQTALAAGAGICPAAAGSHGCTVLTPGLYATGLALKNTTALFQPGIYYMQGSNGFGCLSGCSAAMASPATTDGAAGTNTGWDGTLSGGGILVYNTGTGQFNVGSNGSVSLNGSPATSVYKNILLFEDRTAASNTSANKPKNAHSLGGGGGMTLQGTIYLTNTRATMLGDSTHYQELDLQGSPGSSTTIQGEIIVDALSLGGNASITMNLSSTAAFIISEVALVN